MFFVSALLTHLFIFEFLDPFVYFKGYIRCHFEVTETHLRTDKSELYKPKTVLTQNLKQLKVGLNSKHSKINDRSLNKNVD